MEWLDEIELYLLNRLDTQANHQTDGMKLLNRYPQVRYKMRSYILWGKEVIKDNFEWVEDEIKGTLTNISVGIGREIMNSIKCNKTWKEDTFVKVGDFIVEGFFQVGLIDIITPPRRQSSLPIYVLPTEKWDALIPKDPRILKGVWDKPPGQLNLIQTVQWKDDEPYKVPLIKKWTDNEEPIWNLIKQNTAFVAATKLANTGWVVNEEVYNVVKANPNKFFNPTLKTDQDKSLSISYKKTMETVKELIGEQFYFSIEFDYRGRIYFTCPHFNFQGADFSRGLMLFADKKYVNEDGYRWMKIHAANSYNMSYGINEIPEWCTADYKSHLENEGLDNISVDKMTLTDRVLWVENNWELVYNTDVHNMLHDCEKPVSFLAVCKELVGYSKSSMYFSNLPIPVDGSNNGWQHLGAISKDSLTGSLVGLVPTEIQADFYVQTAKELITLTKDEERLEILSRMPMKHIRKGISKRGSMTRAYSAGAQKIAENMYADCCKEGFQYKYGITEAHCKGFARDLVKAIKNVCPGPLETMKYLQNLATEELERDKDTLAWTTPAGFPVVYECYHTRTPTIISRIRGVNPASRDQVGHKILITSDAPDHRGFMCGISPNFIHSQDAAHMCMVIEKFDGCFGAVHDSFSTHASQVDDLVELTKQTFINMYDHDDYFTDISKRIGHKSEVTPPTCGQLNIKEIKDSDYFFA